jgi:hypothetical protein
MTIQSSYKPFLIGQGQSKTGLFTYLESWIKPEDAYDTLLNAYVYRGSLWQREGTVLFPSLTGNGALVYQNNEVQTATGSGTTGPYSGNLTNFPLIGTVTITAQTAAGKRSSTATFGAGNRPWSTGGTNLAASGTINFSTGAWTITTSSNVVNNAPIVIQYNFIPTNVTSNAGSSINNPIMGIKTHQNAATNTQTLVVMDTRRASWWNSSSLVKSFVPLETFQQIFWTGNGDVTAVTTGDIIIQWTNIAPYSVSITDGTSTIFDIPGIYPAGGFTSQGNLNPAADSTINYATGVVHLNLAVGQASSVFYIITGALQGDYFTGDNSNFFNVTNWQTNDDQPAYLYMTNNVDFVTLFDGTNLARPPFAVTFTDMILDNATSAPLYPKVNDIQTTLDVKVFKNRLLFLRPTLLNDNPDPQTILWSKEVNEFFPLANFNFVSDIAGNGADLAAPTGDWLQCAQFVRDVIIVFFQNSTWLFRFTGNVSDLFRFDKLNASRSTNAPYGSIAYDINATSMGAKGLISCDGVGVDRYDISVIDQFLDINQNFFNLCFTEKFDTLNQTWMLYPSDENNASTSDSVLIYNFLESTWAKFQHNLGNLIHDATTPNTLSCLGLAFTTKDLTWIDFAPGGYFGTDGLNWSQATFPWNSYIEQDLSPSLLGGDQNGFVYTMQDGPVDNVGPDQSTPFGIATLVQTKRLNPFIQIGERARFGYLDIYYEVNPSVQVTFNFYINNSENIAQSNSFTFLGPSSNEWAWKRIYLNVTGEFLQIEINSQIGSNPDGDPIYNTSGVFKILGMILYAAPVGRLTPGTFS